MATYRHRNPTRPSPATVSVTMEPDQLNRDLTSAEIRILTAASLISPSPNPGMRTVSAAALYPTTSTKTLELPEHMTSVAAMEHVGFTPAAATQVFNNYYTCPDPDNYPYGLISHAHDKVKHPRSMAQVGLRTEFQDALLDPTFKDVLRTNTLLYWVQATLSGRYRMLSDLSVRLKRLAERLEGNSAAARCRGVEMPEEVMRRPPPRPEGECYLLYKGQAARTVWYAGEEWEKDGSFNMRQLASLPVPPGDFNGRIPAVYFNLEAETAELYRAWAARRDQYCETLMIRVELPKGYVDGLKQEEVFYGKNWKDLAWVHPSLHGTRFREYREAELIKGHVCTGVQKKRWMKVEEVQEKISKKNAMKVPERDEEVMAVQWAFLSAEHEGLGVASAGNVFVDVIPPECLFGESP
ncbi:hypothetical protein BU16DRAFT_589697 [Lophium mytilinum]|uniref:Uncharacterized protein n=1 Tax=Lophium mytilinum TaxID=390894 RepID=A0A6A6QUP3_9PEZI|nr:hypothetical protein BU16DRAFT_589697 [Lophium mytilinum]